MSRPKLDNIWLEEFQGKKALRADFSNERHHMVVIQWPHGNEELAQARQPPHGFTRRSKVKNPIQPLVKEAHGTLRFKANAIVRHLIDTHPTCDMNHLAFMEFTDDDRQQFAQLIGYSLGGYGELNYVDDHAYATAAEMAESPQLTEDKARIAALEKEIAELREAANALRGPVAVLLGMHPDDLCA